MQRSFRVAGIKTTSKNVFRHFALRRKQFACLGQLRLPCIPREQQFGCTKIRFPEQLGSIRREFPSAAQLQSCVLVNTSPAFRRKLQAIIHPASPKLAWDGRNHLRPAGAWWHLGLRRRPAEDTFEAASKLVFGSQEGREMSYGFLQ